MKVRSPSWSRVAPLLSFVLAVSACSAPGSSDEEPSGTVGVTQERVATTAPAGITLGTDGETAAVYSYANAIRERVFIPVPGVDQNNDGVIDRVAVDVIRPIETATSLKVPAIVFASPYLTSVGEGYELEYLHTTAAGVSDKVPLFYDNYFVPRGYALLAIHALGTGFSTGCPLHGGPGDIAAAKAVIDWLQGRIPAYTSVAGTVSSIAGWHSGKAAMIGKSYDGALAEGTAATGVAGLTTIIPLSAVSDWYGYSRANGIRTAVTPHYPAILSQEITTNTTALVYLGVAPPSNVAACAATRTAMNAADGDDTGDSNAFWTARAYDGSKVHASVFASHGLDDDNVRPDQSLRWWQAIATAGVPRKLWLSQEGHVDPFDYRRAAWVDTLHRWLDYWLLDVQNGIMTEPRVDIETAADTWSTATDWPVPNSSNVDIFMHGTAAGAAGVLELGSNGALDTLSFGDAPAQTEAAMINLPTGTQANRLVFLSPKLSQDLHISGAPVVSVLSTFSTAQSNLGALLVDYGPISHVTRTGDGISATATSTCWGDTLGLDDGCYIEVKKPIVSAASWRISKGIIDSSNRSSLTTPTLMSIGTAYSVTWPLLPTEYVVAGGHQLGVVLVANYPGYSSVVGTAGSQISVDVTQSKLTLPVVGGGAAALAAFEPPPIIADAGTDAAPTDDAAAPTDDAAAPDIDAGATGGASAVTPTSGDAGAFAAAGAAGSDVSAAGEGGSPNQAPPDSGAPNGEVDAGQAGDSAKSPSKSADNSGCSCEIAPAPDRPSLELLVAACFAAAVLRRGRRRTS